MFEFPTIAVVGGVTDVVLGSSVSGFDLDGTLTMPGSEFSDDCLEEDEL